MVTKPPYAVTGKEIVFIGFEGKKGLGLHQNPHGRLDVSEADNKEVSGLHL